MSLNLSSLFEKEVLFSQAALFFFLIPQCGYPLSPQAVALLSVSDGLWYAVTE